MSDNPRDLIEQAARDPLCEAGDWSTKDDERKVYESEIELSKAISLKRIADMLDGTTLGINCMETIFNPQTIQNREVRNHY